LHRKSAFFLIYPYLIEFYGLDFLGFFLSVCPCLSVLFLLPLFLPSNSFGENRGGFPCLPLPNFPKEKIKEKVIKFINA
jgi:hypothetical protein